MLPLIAIATSILPDLIKIIAGDKAGTIATDVANAVKTVTGTSDPVAAKQKLDSDPTAAANLQVQLAQIAITASQAQYAEADKQRQDQLNTLQQQLADVQGARTNLLNLATNKSAIAWVAPAVSMLVMLGFYVLLAILIVFFGKDDAISKNQLINISIGALVAAFSTVVNFWLGSSKGSQDKDQANIQLQSAHAEQTAQTLQTQAKQTTDAINAATNAAATAAAATAAAKAGSAAVGGEAPKTDASTNFSACMAIVFTEEGGYTVDDGGPTNFGITLTDLKDWRNNPNLIADDVKKLTKAEAQEIFRAKYWNPMQCGDLPNGIDLETFDFGVNAGIRRSVKTLQAVLGVSDDGSVGPITLAAAKAADPRSVIQSFSTRRMDYYRSLGDKWTTYGAGWTNRTNSVEQSALKMAGTTVPVA